MISNTAKYIKLVAATLSTSFILFSLTNYQSVFAQTAPITADQQFFETQLRVSHVLFTQSVSGESIALLSLLGTAALDSGMSVAQTQSLIAEARMAIMSRRKALEILGTAVGGDTVREAREQLEVVVKLPSLKDGVLSQVLRRERLGWDASVSEYIPDADNAVVTKVSSALETLRSQQRQAIATISERYNNGDASVRAVYDGTLAPLLDQVKPNSTLEEIVIASPRFAGQPFIREIVDAYRIDPSSSNLINSIKATYNSNLNRLSADVQLKIAGLEAFPSAPLEDIVLGAAEDRLGVNARKVAMAAQQIHDGLSVANADAGVFLSAQVIGVFDNKLGNDIQRVGTAAVEVARIVQSMSSTQSLAGTAGAEIGLAAMTGGTGSVLMAVLPMLGGSSPTSSGPDPVVMDQLIAIRQAISDLGHKMDARFDRVDKGLAQVYNAVQENYLLLERQLNGIGDSTARIEAALVYQDRQLSSMTAAVLNALQQLRDQNSALLLAPCKRWKESSTTISMSPDQFVTCLSRLAQEVDNSSIDLQPFDLGLDDPNLRAFAAAPPLQNLPFLFRLASNLGYGLVPNVMEPYVVDPARWTAATAVYRQLGTEWPSLFKGTPIRQARGLRLRGNTVQEGLDALRSTAVGLPLLKALLTVVETTSDAIASNFDSAESLIRSDNWSGWIAKQGERSVGPCPYAPFTDPVLGKVSRADRVEYQVSASRVEGLHPAFVDELQRQGAGIFSECIELGSMRGEHPGLRVVGWFDTLKPEVKRFLIYDVTLDSGIIRTLPQQLCGIICTPDWKPFIEEIVTSGWANGGRGGFTPATTAWTSDERHSQARQDRDALMEWSLTNVPFVRDSLLTKGYESISGSLPVCISGDQRPLCLLSRLEGVNLVLRSYIELGYQDALSRDDVLRSFIRMPQGMVTVAEAQNWRINSTTPRLAAQILRKRAKALRTLLESELELSTQLSQRVAGPLELGVSRLDAFIEKVMMQCNRNERPASACQ